MKKREGFKVRSANGLCYTTFKHIGKGLVGKCETKRCLPLNIFLRLIQKRKALNKACQFNYFSSDVIVGECVNGQLRVGSAFKFVHVIRYCELSLDIQTTGKLRRHFTTTKDIINGGAGLVIT